MKGRRAALLLSLSLVAACLPDPPTSTYQSGTVIGFPSQSGPTTGGTSASGPPTAAGPQPDFGPTVQLADPPPALSGGTLAVSGDIVVAGDPDRDVVYVIDRATQQVSTIPLSLHDEPGRVVIDDAGHAYVALRAGGAVVTIDLASSTLSARSPVCSAPRGLAFDSLTKNLLVACATGDLVAIDTLTGIEKSRLYVAPDLRDVAITGSDVFVSTFRDAQIYRLVGGRQPELQPLVGDVAFGVSKVAWRMVLSGGEPLVAQQRAPVKDDGGTDGTAAYNSAGGNPGDPMGCMTNGPVPVIRYGTSALAIPTAVLPVDIAVSGNKAAIVAAGNAHTSMLEQLMIVSLNEIGPGAGCSQPSTWFASTPNAQLTSVVFTSTGEVLALSREPAALLEIDPTAGGVVSTLPLSTVSREDTGHAIFHSNSGAGLACASCHPEGREDGQLWSQPTGLHRTPSLLGTVKGTAPYHWMADAPSIGDVMHKTFESRMRGPSVDTGRVAAIEHYLGELRAMPAAATPDASSVSRGKVLYDSTGKCASCHGGAMKTNNLTVDIATGGAFQSPSLVGVAWRAPFLHDGSAPTLQAVLHGAHANVTLSQGQITDLASYMMTF